MAEETQQKILDAVEKLILLKGLSHVTTKEIAHETGLSEGVLYRHFKHKDEIFFAIMCKHLPTLLDAFHVSSPYGVVDWVRNLQAAEEATLTHGRHSETVRARELSPGEGGLVLKALITGSGPCDRYFGVALGAPLEDFEFAAQRHPVFLLQNAN